MKARKPVPSNPKKKRITAVVGKRTPDSGMETTSFVFSPKDAWTAKDARAWLRAHGKKSSDLDETGSSFRFRQADPEDFISTSFRTILITDDPDKMGDLADVAFGRLDQALSDSLDKLLSNKMLLIDTRARNADPRLIARATSDKLMNQWTGAVKAVAEDLDPEDIAAGDEDLFVAALNRYSDRAIQGIAQEAVNMAFRGGRADGLSEEVAMQGLSDDDVTWRRSSALTDSSCPNCVAADGEEIDSEFDDLSEICDGGPRCLCVPYADLSETSEHSGEATS